MGEPVKWGPADELTGAAYYLDMPSQKMVDTGARSSLGVGIGAALLAVGLLAGGCSPNSLSAAELPQAALRIDIDACRTGMVRVTGIALENGWVATVAHAFDGVESFSISDRSAELRYLDFERDIALLRSSKSEFEMSLAGEETIGPAQIITYRRPDVGAEISNVEVLRIANVTLEGTGRRRALELAADINSGDSGAPVINGDGEVIGMIFATNRGLDSGWAIAQSEIRDALKRAGSQPVEPPTCG